MIEEGLANHLGVKVVERLGKGFWGAAFLLENGMVLKITNDVNEEGCVAHITKMKAWELTPHLPLIQQYGWFGLDFYYIREYTNNIDIEIPETYSAEFFEWAEEIVEPLMDIAEVLSCQVGRDAEDPNNWGVRPSDGVLVWRDLSCTC